MTNEDREEVKGLIAQETKELVAKEVRAVWLKWLIAIGAAVGVVNVAAVWSLWTELRSKARQVAEQKAEKTAQAAANKEIQHQTDRFEGIGKVAEARISTIIGASDKLIGQLMESTATAEKNLGGLETKEQDPSKKFSDMEKVSQELRPKLDALQGPGADKALSLISQLNEIKTDEAKSVLDALEVLSVRIRGLELRRLTIANTK